MLCFLAIQLKYRLGFDDALDVIGVHLVGGLFGSLLLGLFADTRSTPPSPTRACSSAAALTCSGPGRGLGRHVLAFSLVVSFVLSPRPST